MRGGDHRHLSIPERPSAGTVARLAHPHRRRPGRPPTRPPHGQGGALRREPDHPPQQPALAGRPGHLRRTARAAHHHVTACPRSRGASRASLRRAGLSRRHQRAARQARAGGGGRRPDPGGGGRGRSRGADQPHRAHQRDSRFLRWPLGAIGLHQPWQGCACRRSPGLRLRLHGHALHRHAGIPGGRRLSRDGAASASG
ncbi:hypothetical protein D3C72_668490 [compost metagenome]